MPNTLTNKSNMKLQHAPIILMSIMTVIILNVVGLTIWLLYDVGYDQQRQRLIEMVETQSQMIQTIAEHEFNDDLQNIKKEQRILETAEMTLKQVMAAHQEDIGLGKTGEFTLAKLHEGRIDFLLRHRHNELKRMHSISIDATSAEPMRRALHGKKGTVVGPDYRDETVLAAYKPIKSLGWGIVAKIDLAEIRKPYIMAGLYAFIGALIFIVIGSGLFFRVLRPILQRLENSNRYNRMLFNHSPTGLVLCRMNGDFVDVNGAFAAIIGRTIEETLPLNYWDITPASYKPQEEHQLAKLKKKGHFGPYEKEYIHKDGHLVPVSLSGRMLEISGESYIWTSVEDISERKKNEVQIRQASQVFDNADEGIVITDARRNIVRVNRAFSRITGYSFSEVVGRNPRILQSGRHDKGFFKELWQKIEQEGRWRGEMWNRRKDGKQFPALQSITEIRNYKGEVESYVSVFSDITELKAYEEQLAHLANHDALTGLSNRMQFESNLEHTLQRAKRNQMRFALLFLDLNHFKEINDTFGHDTGDFLLQAVAGRLKERLRGEDVVARLGGDEFTVILSEITKKEDAELVVQKLIEAIEVPLEAEGKVLHPQISVGISVYPDDGHEATVLLKAADTAMYEAKQSKTQSYAFYDKKGE